MSIFGYSFREFFKKNKIVLFYMIIIFSFYLFSKKIVRPYSYENYPDFKNLNFILGILPNFLGSILTYLMFNGLLEISKIRSAIYVMVLVIFMEGKAYFYGVAAFDIYDIIASIIAIGIIFLLQSNVSNKSNNY